MKLKKKKINKSKSPPPKKINKPKSLKLHFHEALDTIHLARKCIYFGIGLFAVLTLVGYFFPIFYVDQITNILKGLFLEFQGLTIWQTILKIFINNTLVSFMTIVLGILIGLFPLMTIIQNGYILGFVARTATRAEGLGILWRLLPHGIFELPAIFIAIGLGLKLGEKVLKRDKPIKFLGQALKVFVLIIIPLLVVAAVIEGTLIGLGA